MRQATSTQSGTNVRFCGGPGGPGIVRAVSTGLCRDLTGTRLFLGRDGARPSRCGIQKSKDEFGLCTSRISGFVYCRWMAKREGRAPSRPREGWVPVVFLQNPADTARTEPGPPGVPQKS